MKTVRIIIDAMFAAILVMNVIFTLQGHPLFGAIYSSILLLIMFIINKMQDRLLYLYNRHSKEMMLLLDSYLIVTEKLSEELKKYIKK